MSAFIDLTGRIYGFLEVIKRSANRIRPCGASFSSWLCRCVCGNEVVLTGSQLKTGNTKSCGCKKSVMCRDVNLVHGLSRTYVESTRRAAIQRCYDPNSVKYYRYGARGIRICEGLRNSTPNWLSLLGPRPPKHSIHRINNDGHYTCGECAECLKCGYKLNLRWETAAVQNRHKSNSRMVTIDGVTLNACDWPARLGISQRVFRWRYIDDQEKIREQNRNHKRKIRKEKKGQVEY